ncbi:MAG: sporulation protein YunB [Bacillota bacterium]
MKRIKSRSLPKRRPRRYLKRKTKKTASKGAIALLIISLFIISSIFITDQQIAPILNSMAKQKTYLEVTKAMEKAVQQEMKANPQYHNYQELVYVEKDQNGNIVLLVPNTMKLNLLISNIVLQVEDNLENLQNNKFSIPLGATTNSKLFSSIGPNIPIDIWPIGSVHTQIKDDFVSQGINQTRHRIWLELESTFSIVIPFDKEQMTVNTSVLLCEGIIVGPIPDTYFNINNSLNH